MTTNKIGELTLQRDIKILDGFDFPDEFSAISLENIKEGHWVTFNQTHLNSEFEEIEVLGFHMISKDYLLSHPEFESYEWKKYSKSVSIENNCLGVFNRDFNPNDLETYLEQVSDSLEVEEQAFTTDNYVIFGTPFSDGVINISTVSENNKTVAILFSFQK